MEKMTNVICTRLFNGYKITYCAYTTVADIAKLGSSEYLELLKSKVIAEVGYWVGYCNDEEMRIVEFELVLPPLSEYSHIEQYVSTFLREEHQIRFSIAIGLPIVFTDENGELSRYPEGLEILKRRNTNMN